MAAPVPLSTHLFLLVLPLLVSVAALTSYLRGGRRGR